MNRDARRPGPEQLTGNLPMLNNLGAVPRFPKAAIEELESAKILGVRSGRDHRFTGVWVVVVNGRVFARSWSDKPTGWFRAFLDQPSGAIQCPSGRQIRVRARKVRGERLLDAIDGGFAAKYTTPAARKWVRGFARPARRATTMEFLPASAAAVGGARNRVAGSRRRP